MPDAAGARERRWWPRGSSNGDVVFETEPSTEAFRKPEKKWRPGPPPAGKGVARPAAAKVEVEDEWLDPMPPVDGPAPRSSVETVPASKSFGLKRSPERASRSDPTVRSAEEGNSGTTCSAEDVQEPVEKEPPDRGRRGLNAGAAAWRPASALAVLLAVGAAEDAAGRAAAVEALGSWETHAAWEEQVGGLGEAESAPPEFVFFRSHRPEDPSGGEYACFSNWFESPIVDDVGRKFANAEQFLMHRKAQTFGDETTAEAVLAEPDPARVKALGRGIAPYDDVRWAECRGALGEDAVFRKFLAHPALAEVLLGTGEKVLVESSADDAVWGVGLDRAECEQRVAEGGTAFEDLERRIAGGNLLGKALMTARSGLRWRRDCAEMDGAMPSYCAEGRGVDWAKFGGVDELGSDEPGVDDVSPAERARREAVKEENLLPGAPRGLPACMKVKWRTLVADARLLLEAGELDDEGIVDEIAAFEETGGFRAFGLPLERTFDEKDCPNAPMDLDMLKTWWLEMRTELDEGWVDRYGVREDLPYAHYRVNKCFWVPKMEEGKQKTKVRVDPLDGVEREMPRWRLCEHMSFAPRGHLSLNEVTEMGYDLRKGTPGQLEDVDDAAEKTVRFLEAGHEVEYAKADIAHAYRNFPIAAVDRCQFVLYGLDPSKPFPRLEDLDFDEDGNVHLRPEQSVYLVRNVLPFGWAKSVSWFWRTMRVVKRAHLFEGTPGLKTAVPREMHDTSAFLDDSLLMARKGWCAASKQRLFELYERYGLPVEMAKDAAEGGVETTKSYLGVLLDALRHELRMSDARMEQILRRLVEVGGKSFLKRDELQSLVGVLSFAAKACPPGRTFLRRMISALRRRGRFVRLNRGIKADIAWWKRYGTELNGSSLFLAREWLDAEELHFYTDASLDGYGAAFLVDGKLEYFGGPWSDFGIDGKDGSWHISELEALALVMAVATWGSKLSRRRVVVRVDNEATVTAVNKARCADPGMMVCMRELFFVMARDSFALRCKWIGTKENVLADAASRAEWARFRAYAAAEFGVAAEDMMEVPVGFDTRDVLRRMEKSHRAAERR